MMLKDWDVYRVRIGMGLVDYCGQVRAATVEEAESSARLMYPYDHGAERLDIEEAK